MEFNYLNYELAKEKGYIDNAESYKILIKAAFTSLDNMKYDINHNCKLCNNKGDAFVFVDDNPAERNIVTSQLPSVAVPKMDAAENYIKILDHSGYFEVTTLSDEDMNRMWNRFYKLDELFINALNADFLSPFFIAVLNSSCL